MGTAGTALIYGLLGVVIAVTHALRAPGSVTAARLVACAVAWPFYAPWVLARPRAEPPPPPRVDVAKRGLSAALAELGALAGPLAPEIARAQRLTEALTVLERRLAEMDALIASPEFDPARVQAALADLRARGLGDDDPRVRSVVARGRNIERLRRMRDGAGAEVERALLRLEEMVGHLRLLRFTDGAGAADVVALLDETAAVVEALGEGLWPE